MTDIGLIIKYFRYKKKITQKDLAANVGITHPTLSRMEKGGYFRDLEMVLKHLNVELHFIEKNENTETKENPVEKLEVIKLEY